MTTNRFLDEVVYANTMLALVKNQLVYGRLVNGRFEDQVTDENGLSINVKRPPRFVAKDGAALAEQSIISGSENVKVDQYKNVHVGIGDLESIQSFNDLMESSTMRSAASELAHTVDLFLAEKVKEFYSWVGTPGNVIASPQEFNPAHTRLMEQSVPNDQLSAALTFADGEQIRGNLQATDIGSINRDALSRTRIPIISEVDVFATQNISQLVTGSRTNGAVNGASQSVDYRDVKDNAQLRQNLNIDGLGANATISKGEVFTIADVFAINPRTRLPYGRLQQFTVLADVTANATGEATVAVTPPIVVSGVGGSADIQEENTQFAMVSAVPADNAVVTFAGSADTNYDQRAVFHRDAISLVSARLQEPFSGVSSFSQDPETGIAIRYWRDSDSATGKHIHRWDMVYGAATMDTSLGTRVDGPS